MIKRIFILAFVLVMCLSLISPAIVSAANNTLTSSASSYSFLMGTGYGSNGKFLSEIEEPVENSIPIENREQLEKIGNDPDYPLNGNYHLIKNIDLAGVEWIPIGDYENPFIGIFDGQGYMIENMTITKVVLNIVEMGNVTNVISGASALVGLFGRATGMIVNVGLINTNIDINLSRSGAVLVYVGAIVGRASIIHNCFNEGEIIISILSTDFSSGLLVGGLSGESSAISSSYNNASIIASASSPFELNANYGKTYTQVGIWAGGIVGRQHSSTFHSFNSGDIIVTAVCKYGQVDALVGGIAGGEPSTIENCYNVGNIKVEVDCAFNSGTRAVGGIIGASLLYAGKGISNCYNAGDVSLIVESPSILYTTSTGGISGCFSRPITNCVTLSNQIIGTQTSADSAQPPARIINNGTSLYPNNAAADDISGNAENEANKLLPRGDFFKKSTWEVLGFKFGTVWRMPKGGGFPVFIEEFIPRKTAPQNNNIGNNRYYRKTTVGGLNECILGSNQKKYPGSVMPNCVGYAWGRAYELLGSRPNLSKSDGKTFWKYKDGYKRGQTPRLGAIVCWQGGNVGHVAVVEAINGNIIIISESTFGSDTHPGIYYQTREGTIEKLTKDLGKTFKFDGYIYLW